MGNQSNSQSRNLERKIYIDLLSNNELQQPEYFCGNEIKTTRFTM